MNETSVTPPAEAKPYRQHSEETKRKISESAKKSHPRKLTDDKIRIIRNLLELGVPKTKIATKAKVSTKLISLIASGKAYVDVI